jgi:signal peptide peptidase SppA
LNFPEKSTKYLQTQFSIRDPELTKFYQKFLPKKFTDKGITIPVVRLSGMIASGGSALRPNLSLASCANVLEKAFSDKKAPAVAISINSPGGSPVQSRLIFLRIRQLAEEKEKMVHVFVEDVAASGGYMIAVAGDDITVDPSSIIGSIGVVSASFGFPELLKKAGIERRVYTAGTNKSTLDPFMPEKEDDIAHLKKLQLEVHQVFIDMVKKGRGARLGDDADLFTGLFWAGQKGVDLGLADAIGDMRSSLIERYGKDTKLKLIEAKKGLFGRRQPGVALGGMGVELAANITENALSTLEERALWSRYGL